MAPLVVAAQALPANAATGKLLVTTIGRDGHAVTGAYLTLVDLGTGVTSYNDTSGHAVSLADGKYAVLAGIEQTVNGITNGTLDATTVTVSGTGTTRITLDARQGHLIRATLDGKALSDYTDARVCASVGLGQLELFENQGPVYVVPSSSSLFSFGFLAEGQGAVVTGQTRSGIPSSPGGAWKSSQLAQVNLTVRAGEMAGTSMGAEVQPENSDGSWTCGTDLGTSPANDNVAPFREAWRVSPGYWVVRTDDYGGPGDIGGYFIKQHLLAGRSYALTYGLAAWAPTGMYTMISRHALYLFAPEFADPDGNGNDTTTMNHLGLSLNGHLVASANVTDYGNAAPAFNPGISAAGWYTLTDSATRYYPGFAFPSTILSPRVTFAWRFYASPSWTQEAAGFWTSFQPEHLSLANSAAPASTTTVLVRPYRDSSNPNVPVPADSVTKLQVWSSVDGVHWTALAVSHGSSGWSVVVRNPATGTISLRATVTGSHGDTSTETVYKAYAIS
jgi:hypothetical protein